MLCSFSAQQDDKNDGEMKGNWSFIYYGWSDVTSKKYGFQPRPS